MKVMIMKVITDASASLTPDQALKLNVDIVPFQITFMGKTYRDGQDLSPADLYRLYSENPDQYSETSQPAVGDFLSAYERNRDKEIISIHLSSGLSGAYSSAEHAARMMPDRAITVIDSGLVGPALGWMVEAAAKGVEKGWPKEKILAALREIRENTLTMVAFSELKYLFHSGRVSHLKSIVASLMRLKPIIGMNEQDGRYSNLGQEPTMGRVVRKMVKLVHNRFNESKLRLQLMHGNNLEGVDLLRQALHSTLKVVEGQVVTVPLVLGAHTGPTVIGLVAAPQEIFDRLYA